MNVDTGIFLGLAPILLALAIPLVTIIGIVVLAALGIMKGGSRSKSSAEEARAVQAIHQGLSRMEKRIDALEAIIYEPDTDKEGTNERQA